jgi:NAD(P) transhydrogenase subunit beta
MSSNLSALLYLITGVLFILALRGLSSPGTSRMGNIFGILGMLLAIIVTFLSIDILIKNFVLFIITF